MVCGKNRMAITVYSRHPRGRLHVPQIFFGYHFSRYLPASAPTAANNSVGA